MAIFVGGVLAENRFHEDVDCLVTSVWSIACCTGAMDFASKFFARVAVETNESVCDCVEIGHFCVVQSGATKNANLKDRKGKGGFCDKCQSDSMVWKIDEAEGMKHPLTTGICMSIR